MSDESIIVQEQGHIFLAGTCPGLDILVSFSIGKRPLTWALKL